MVLLSKRLAKFVAACAFAAGLVACGGGGESAPAPATQKADVSAFTGHGVYWNPAEPGSGFFFESQGALGVVTFYLYETTGRAVWYSAVGSFTSTGATTYRFEGELQRFTGGQTDSSTLSIQPTGTAMGKVTLDFDGYNVRVSVPGRTYTAEKFYKDGGQGPTTRQPETGIYWIPAENGRGYTVEVRDGIASVTVFHYTATGEPTWHLVTLRLPATPTQEAQSDFTLYEGGQSLTGPHRTPRSSSGGTFRATLDDACGGRIASPMAGGGLIRRFAFGSLPPGAECRTPGARAAAAWPATTSVSSIQYDIGRVGESPAEAAGHIVSQGRLGFTPYRPLPEALDEQIFIRFANRTYQYQRLAPTILETADANRFAAEGYRFLGQFDPYDPANETYFSRTGNTARYEYLLEPYGEPWPTTTQFLDRLNALGAQGYRHTAMHFRTDANRKVFERDKSFTARFLYEQQAMPASETAFLAALNERGARGFRFVGTRRPTDVPIADNALLFEKDTTQTSTVFSYYRRDIPASVWDRLAVLNGEGNKGAILQSVTPIGGTAPAYLFYTRQNCSGPLCEPQRLVHDFIW